MKRKTGTREWAAKNANCLIGCEHDCRYCYARAMAERFNRLRQVDGGAVVTRPWSHVRVNASAMGKAWGKVRGVVMFPSAHDITPATVDVCEEFAKNILRAGNRLLIVTKPHLSVIRRLLDGLSPYRGQVEFRFTITACDDDLLAYWEPGAPRFAERYESLRNAYCARYPISVSIEPMLDPANVPALVETLYRWVSGDIWIGKMRDVRRRVKILTPEDLRQVERIEAGQTDDKIVALVHALSPTLNIRWKDSIEEVIARNT